ncbi:unnamed protein product [Anisakis simplex]|uniref:Uncharacterized protein n=1 Tax=Anisakis simplex TaxID=6269 RepID=A0A3P6NSA6_ANISI|nr:unnamed protein product [Anisakis simplex]
MYSHRSAELETPTVMEPDLKLCLVRPAPSNVERACCFELVTPTKSHLLQADSDTLCNAWMRALQRTIHHLHESDDSVIESTKTLLQTTLADCDWNNPDESEGTSANGNDNNMDTAKTTSDKHVKHQSHSSAQQNQHQQQQQQNISLPSTSTKEKGSFLSELRRIPGNDKCADCGADAPKWASINIGVLLCIECCGIHRSFGVQISKIRSLTMDSFELEQRKLMLSLGNRLVNSIYLAYLPTDESVMPPQAKPSSTR